MEQSYFEEYTVVSSYSDLVHPAVVVETSSLSNVPYPELNYNDFIPLNLLLNPTARLSGVQMDAVVLAGMAHSKIFPDTKARQGMLIGDGTGVGKGRMLAGIILDNHQQGRTKALYISASRLLFEDLKRDLKAIIGGTEISIPLFELPHDYDSVKWDSGILYCTYSGLCTTKKIKLKDGFKTRIDQVIDWLGKNFDGPLIFDEAHRAKGYTSTADSSITGSAVVNLQRTLKKARVVYVSATVATTPSELQFMDRLGLWGETTGFETAEAFVNAITNRGVSGCELVALELKQRGIFVSRHLSFVGISFDLELVQSTMEFKQLYNECTAIWLLILKEFTQMKEDRLSIFWAAHQKFFKSLCVSAKVPQTVAYIRKCLKAHKSVVVGIQSTGQAAFEGFRDSPYHSDKEPCSPARWYLEEMLIKKLKILPQELGLVEVEKVKNKGMIKLGGPSKPQAKRRKLDLTEYSDDDESMNSDIDLYSHSDKEEMENVQSTELDSSDLRQKIIAMYKKVHDRLPFNTIDVLKMHFQGNISEISGRTLGQLLKTNSDGKVFAVCYGRSAGLNKTEQELFRDGNNKVIVISEAGSTGLSLQSNKEFKNRDPRVHIILEAPWSATTVSQQMGRTNRSNQVNKPAYTFLMSDIPGEQRFAVSLGQKMANMGALCKGDQRSSFSEIWENFSVRPDIAKRSIKELLNCIIGLNSIVNIFNDCNQETRLRFFDLFFDMGLITKDKKGGFHPNLRFASLEKFLNRVLGLEIQYQSSITKWLDVTMSKVKSWISAEGETGTIQDLNDLIPGNINFITTIKNMLPNETTSNLHIFSIRNFLEWEELQTLSITGYYKTKCASGEDMVVAISKSYSKLDKESYALEVFKPYRKISKIKSRKYMGEKKFIKIKEDEALRLWEKNLNFFRIRGNCIQKFKTGFCDLPCRHKIPYSHVGILSGGCLNHYNSIKDHVTNNTITVTIFKSDKVRAAGVFIPSSGLKAIRRLLLQLGPEIQ